MRGPAFNAEAVINTADDAYEHIARGQIKAHLGAVNDIVLIGNFVCSCAGDAMIRLTDVKNLEPKV